MLSASVTLFRMRSPSPSPAEDPTPSPSLVRASHHLGPTPPSTPVLRLQPKLPNVLYLFTWDTCSNFPHHPLQQFYHPPDPPFPSHATAWSRPTVGTSFPLDIVTWNSNGFGVTKIWAWIPPPSSEVLSKLLNFLGFISLVCKWD